MHHYICEMERKLTVTVYTLPACVQCNSTKKVLDQKSISYDEVDLSEDKQALDYVKSLGYTAAPVVVAGDSHWAGFRPDLINNLSL
jgi:glutaredoxin-like protein NrdH